MEDQNCMADYVSIYDGSEMKDEKLLLRTCGSQEFGPDTVNQTARPGFTKPVRSTSNEMLIVMETDDSIEAKGFAAQFETVVENHHQTIANIISFNCLWYFYSHVVQRSIHQPMAFWKLVTIFDGLQMAANGLLQQMIQV